MTLEPIDVTFEPIDRTVIVDGVTLHYRETGSASGVPVVALHGHPGTAATWDETAVGVCGAGDYRFLALTQRGYGLSERVGPYSLETLAADVLAFAAALGLGRFVLIGHSMGGTVASIAAAQAPSGQAPSAQAPSGLSPSQLLGLVLEDSVTPREGVELPIPARPTAPESLPYDWNLVPAILGQVAAPDPAWWTGLSRITAPTLVIAGGSTSHVPQSMLADAAAVIPQATLVTLEGAGHSVHRDAPARLLAELTGFLNGLTPNPAKPSSTPEP